MEKIMGIIYLIETIVFFVILLMMKKSEEKLNIIKYVIITIASILSYNLIVCFLLSIVKLQINIQLLSIIEIIPIVLAHIKVFKDKGVQKYFFDSKDIIFIVIIFLIAIPIIWHTYEGFDAISYRSGDGGTHFTASMMCYKSGTIFLNGLFEGHMPQLYTNESIIYKALGPIVGEFNLYRLFLILDATIWICAIVIFYLLIKEKIKMTYGKFAIICIASIIFALGYPLNSYITGFHYLQAGINYILLTALLIDENNIDKKWKILFLSLINIGVIFSYNLFAPLVYLAEFVYILIENYTKNKILINKHIVLECFWALFVPGILAILYFVVFRSNNYSKIVTGLTNDGFIFKNKWSTIILFIPFSIFWLINTIKNKEYKSNYAFIFFICLTLYTITFYILYKNGIISSYYYHKLYFLIWPIVIMASTLGCIMLFDKGEICKYVVTILIAVYISTMIVLVTKIEYKYASQDVDEQESITTIMGIFNINKKILNTKPILTGKEIQGFKYMSDNNLDCSKMLVLNTMNQQDWINNIIYYLNPKNVEFFNYTEECQKWNNGEFDYLYVFKNRRLSKLLLGYITLENSSVIYSNDDVEIWKYNIK